MGLDATRAIAVTQQWNGDAGVRARKLGPPPPDTCSFPAASNLTCLASAGTAKQLAEDGIDPRSRLKFLPVAVGGQSAAVLAQLAAAAAHKCSQTGRAGMSLQGSLIGMKH